MFKMTKKRAIFLLPYGICLLFFLAYATLSVVRHDHFLSGYDLGVSDQGIWSMSKFKAPISTSHAYAFTSLYADHVEIIYALLSPIYWFFNDTRILLVIQALVITFSGIPIYLFAQLKKLRFSVSFALLVSFLLFYGIQNAIWADVHSLVFAAALMPWFIYFLETGKTRWTLVTFALLLSCKEDIALFTFLISFVWFIVHKKKIAMILMGLSLAYLAIIFGIYYPHFTPNGYRFQNQAGLLSNIDLSNMYNTSDKRDVLFYSIVWFGFLPVFAPLSLIPAVGDLFHYFVLGSNYVTSAQGMFLHYRVTLAMLLVWPTIIVISKYKKFNTIYIATYLLLIAFFLQYWLHLPLSYLTKRWFWTPPASVATIKGVLSALPPSAPVVSQVNITPHINHRDFVFTLWPEKKTFSKNSPCGQKVCNWFRWAGSPAYLVVDTSTDWDARYWLTDRDTFIDGIHNLEKAKVIKLDKQEGTSVLYKVLKNP